MLLPVKVRQPARKAAYLAISNVTSIDLSNRHYASGRRSNEHFVGLHKFVARQICGRDAESSFLAKIENSLPCNAREDSEGWRLEFAILDRKDIESRAFGNIAVDVHD